MLTVTLERGLVTDAAYTLPSGATVRFSDVIAAKSALLAAAIRDPDLTYGERQRISAALGVLDGRSLAWVDGDPVVTEAACQLIRAGLSVVHVTPGRIDAVTDSGRAATVLLTGEEDFAEAEVTIAGKRGDLATVYRVLPDDNGLDVQQIADLLSL